MLLRPAPMRVSHAAVRAPPTEFKDLREAMQFLAAN